MPENYDDKLLPKVTRGQTIREWAGTDQPLIFLVFTDIIDSTAICVQVGNDAWVELLIKHFNAARQQCLKCSGYEIKLIGDAYMAVFRRIVDAFTFIQNVYLDTGDPLIQIRAGVHLGEVRIIQDDIFGSMVNYTARVQHSWGDKPNVILSHSAKLELESEFGTDSIIRLTHKRVASLKGFKGPHFTWAVITEAMRAAQLKREITTHRGERAASVLALAQLNTDEAFHQICAAFDDREPEVREAAARALYRLADDRADSFTRALREAAPERRRYIGAAISASGLADEAVSNLTGESRDKTYDAFSLLFLMAKAGETAPLIHSIETHPDNEVRLAVVKLLALSGQHEILPSFRRLAVRGSLPTEVRSAVMEAIYQISSQPQHTT